MTTTAPMESTHGTIDTITGKAVCLVLHRSQFRTRRRAALTSVDVDASVDDERFFRVSKILLHSDALRSLERLFRQVDRFIRTDTGYCLPSNGQAGVYWVPTASITALDLALMKIVEQIPEKVAALQRDWPRALADAKTTLEAHGAWDLKDYPPVERLPAFFHLSWRYLAFTTPYTLGSISRDLLARETEKQRQFMLEESTQIRRVLRATMAKLVTHLTRLLSETTRDGKRRVLRDRSLDPLLAFVASWQQKNLTNDMELDTLVKRVRDITNGVDAKLLRSDDACREYVAREMGSVGDLAKTLIDEVGREITFGDD